jgi:hypothetical protein
MCAVVGRASGRQVSRPSLCCRKQPLHYQVKKNIYIRGRRGFVFSGLA